MSSAGPAAGEGGCRVFEAEIREGRGGGAWVEIPFDVAEVWGARGRVPVRASFDGHRYAGSVAPMGGCHVLGVRKDVRAAIGKGVGDRVRVEVERDASERTVDVPAELAAALRDHPEEREAFRSLSFTHRREYAEWVAEARKQETRDRRAAKAVAMIRGGKTR